MTKVVIIGGGFAGAFTAAHLKSKLSKSDEILLITKEPVLTYKPLLQEVATHAFPDSLAAHPLPDVSLITATVSSVNLATRTVSVAKKKITYDYLVIATGSQPNFFNTPGAEEHALSLNSIKDAQQMRAKITKVAKKAKRIIVVGGGPLGIEISSELADFLKSLKSKASVLVINRGTEILGMVDEPFRNKAELILHKKNIKLLNQAAVKKVTARYVETDTHGKIPADLVIWTAGVKPSPLEIKPTPTRGIIEVDECLRLQHHDNVFAAGDCALSHNPNGAVNPTTAQVAVQQAKTLAHNIAASINGTPLKPFEFKDKGFALPLGKGNAIAIVKKRRFTGFIGWSINRAAYLYAMYSWRHRIQVFFSWAVGLLRKR